MEVCGPAVLAVRPRLWRSSAAVPLLKKGPTTDRLSFRLIMVKAQMGLLQEGIIFRRLRYRVRASITPGQSGYVRDVGDAHLLLHECTAEAIGLNKPLWAVFGDLEQAFPRMWRQCMLRELKLSVGIRDGMLALLGSIMDHDRVHIYLSGASVVCVVQGVSEGGLLGPLAFPSYMETLTKELHKASSNIVTRTMVANIVRLARGQRVQ